MAFKGTREQLHQKEAFEYYYSLGVDRSYSTVAKEYEVSAGTVANWGKAFSWLERVELRDNEIIKGKEKKTIDALINEKANYRKIVKALIYKFAQQVQVDKLSADSIQDFERLIKLDLMLMGEQTFEDGAKEIVIKIEGI